MRTLRMLKKQTNPTNIVILHFYTLSLSLSLSCLLYTSDAADDC